MARRVRLRGMRVNATEEWVKGDRSRPLLLGEGMVRRVRVRGRQVRAMDERMREDEKSPLLLREGCRMSGRRMCAMEKRVGRGPSNLPACRGGWGWQR